MTRHFIIPFILAGIALGGCGAERTPDAQTQTVIREKPKPVPAEINFVVIGDSLAQGTGDETGRGIAGGLEVELRLRGVETVFSSNLGINGSTTSDLVAQLKQERTRTVLSKADVIVLSIGANDLFRTQNAREETLSAPLIVAERILERLEVIVADLRHINLQARILILGGYNPVRNHPMAGVIENFLTVWDAALARRFKADPRVSIVRIADIIDRPDRLSRHDNFHPGGEAYRQTAKRIAGILLST